MKQSQGIRAPGRAWERNVAWMGLYPLALALLLVAVYAPLVLHPGSFLYPRGGHATDLTITHWPAVAFNAQTLRDFGQIPLWRTTVAGGGPWIANPQSWLTYPPAWLSLILRPIVALNVLLLGHLALAAFGTYIVARRVIGLGSAGAALAGLAFAGAPWISGQLSAGHLNIVFALAWLPVALGALDRVAREGSAGAAPVAGLAWAAALVNHIQTALFVMALSAGWFVFVLVRRERAGAWKRPIAVASLAPLIAALLSAVLLVPLGEALPTLNRTALSVKEAGVLSLTWPQLLTTLIPTYGGEPEQVVYLGLPILLLAAASLALRRDGTTWFLVLSAALTALFALGTHAPLFPLLVRAVPGAAWLRVPPRAWVVVSFAMALLAGRGLDTLAQLHLGHVQTQRVMRLALVALTAGLALATGLALIQRPIPPAVATLAVLTVLVVAAVLLRVRRVAAPGVFAVAMLALTAVDLGAVRLAWTEMIPADEAFAWGAEAAAYLAEQPGLFRTYSPDYSIPQHVAVDNGLYLADGVDPIQLRRYAEYLAEAGGYAISGYSPSLPPVHGDLTARPDAHLLGRLNVRFVAAGYPIAADGLALRTGVGDTYVYENEYALPRAFVVTSADPWRVSEASHAQITSYTPNEIVVEVKVEEPGILVLSEVCYPGWQARVDEEETRMACVNKLFRGVELDAGRHTVTFEYTPWSVRLGAAISAATLAGLALYAGYRVWRAR